MSARKPAPETPPQYELGDPMSEAKARAWADWGSGIAMSGFWAAVYDDSSPAWALKVLLEGVCDIAAMAGGEDLMAEFVRAQLIGRREVRRHEARHGVRPAEAGPGLERAHGALVKLEAAIAEDRSGVLARRRPPDTDAGDDVGDGGADMRTWARLIKWTMKACAPEGAHWVFTSIEDTAAGQVDPDSAQFTTSPTSAAVHLMLVQMGAALIRDAHPELFTKAEGRA